MKFLSLSIFSFFLFSGLLSANEIQVCSKVSPPFSMKSEDGSWSGLSIDLLEATTDKLGIEYRIREMPIDDLISGLYDGRCDLSISALTITAERERVVDFSAPYYSGGLGIAAREGESTFFAIVQTVKKVFSFEMFLVVLSLLLVLLLTGAIVWVFERKENKEEFGGSLLKGLGSGLWWSAVTMTTVGYGDKAPKTLGGRIVALIWMFTAIVVISSFTAGIASIVTVSNISSSVSGLGDLHKIRVGSVKEAFSGKDLDSRNISFRSYKSVEQGLRALKEREIVAFVYDAPILRYMRASDPQYSELQVLSNEFSTQLYAVAFPQGSSLRESFNRALLEFTASSDWKEVVEEYLE